MKQWKNPFADLTGFERGLWGISVAVIALSAVLAGGADVLSVIASLIGVTALIFVAKGYVIGQVLTVVFSVMSRMPKMPVERRSSVTKANPFFFASLEVWLPISLSFK